MCSYRKRITDAGNGYTVGVINTSVKRDGLYDHYHLNEAEMDGEHRCEPRGVLGPRHEEDSM